jgi:hypothetical protein
MVGYLAIGFPNSVTKWPSEQPKLSHIAMSQLLPLRR